ncbi:hypothetical protein K502DRAFT_340431 [Neoconidiobolus thromboides FSU 785]|nr:hypothetical protein K502DRAFT_340431 [Neoconidiobolus thromboides FSU 785]
MKIYLLAYFIYIVVCQKAQDLPSRTIDQAPTDVKIIDKAFPTEHLVKAVEEATSEIKVETVTSVASIDEDIYTTVSTVYVDTKGNVLKDYKPVSTDQGLETLKNAGIGIGVVIVVVLIGIFILRKWKFSPTTRFRQKLENSQNFAQRSNESDTMFLRELHAP